jgi:hypothetical protein
MSDTSKKMFSYAEVTAFAEGLIAGFVASQEVKLLNDDQRQRMKENAHIAFLFWSGLTEKKPDDKDYVRLSLLYNVFPDAPFSDFERN